jgi:glycosyltransferase involved in cell wall biosynthesis
LDQSFRALPEEKTILFVGRLHPIKGLDLLIQAYAQVCQEISDPVRLVLVGPDQGSREILSRLATALGVRDRVVFTGPLFGPEKEAILWSADLFVMPSLTEGFSVAVLEAMAHRLPVIITDTCNFPEVVSEQAGLVVSRDVGRLARSLAVLLRDEERRKAMGRRGRHLVKKCFTWDSIAAQFMRLYQESFQQSLLTGLDSF